MVLFLPRMKNIVIFWGKYSLYLLCIHQIEMRVFPWSIVENVLKNVGLSTYFNCVVILVRVVGCSFCTLILIKVLRRCQKVKKSFSYTVSKWLIAMFGWWNIHLAMKSGRMVKKRVSPQLWVLPIIKPRIAAGLEMVFIYLNCTLIIYFFLYRLGHSFCTRGDQGSSSSRNFRLSSSMCIGISVRSSSRYW